MKKRRKKRRVRLSEEEIRRRKRIKKKRKKLAMRRRAYALLLCAFMVLIAFIFFKAGKKSGDLSVSGNDLLSAGAEGFMGKSNENELIDNNADYPVQSMIESTIMSDNTVLKGHVTIDVEPVTDEDGNTVPIDDKTMLSEAKKAMGRSVISQTLLQFLPDGGWHAITTTSNELCVFFSGHHDDKSVRFVYVFYSDGSFELQEIRVDGTAVEDMQGYLTKNGLI